VHDLPPAARVTVITFVPFLPDGRCVLAERPDGSLALPAGEVLPGEDYAQDTVLRVPLEAAGFRYQRFRPFRLDGDHLYAWIEGAPYTGSRPHAEVPLRYCTPEEAAQLLGDDVVLAAAASYRGQSEEEYYAHNVRSLEQAYLRGVTAQEGSGFGGDAVAWRHAREHLTEAINVDGTFLDVGCANGLLMESVAVWCAERGLAIEPYGIDLSTMLAELARRRLPAWADRIWAGNAISWLPPDGLRFRYVHILLDCVPRQRHADLVRHHLAHTVASGGRLLVSHYGSDPASGSPFAADILRSLGFACTGQTSGGTRPGRLPNPAAWIDLSSGVTAAEPPPGNGQDDPGTSQITEGTR
jgi:hypothetical protein